MLTEQFIASIAAHTKANTGVTKDAGIFLHEHQPLTAQRHVFKKSATAPHGLAVSRSHVFAAQDGKAVVHVYSREKGNQEAVVPFPERICSVAIACKGSVLLLGTESGRILAWEVCSGRLVSTVTSHLQSVTCIAVDNASQFFLTGSPDAMIHVWALPAILSFSPESRRTSDFTLSSHRGPISSIACGLGPSNSNIAISISEDKTAIIWNYFNGVSLRTYLLPEVPRALAIDPANRGFYIAYDDGSLQTVDFYDEAQKGSSIDRLRDGSSSHTPVQPPSKARFQADSQKLGTAISLDLSWDGTTLISGHENGKIATWDIARSSFVGTTIMLPGPVTNLLFLVPTGFHNAPEPPFAIPSVVKPKQDAPDVTATSSVPLNYTLTMQFTGDIPNSRIYGPESQRSEKSDFEKAFAHPCFPKEMLEESLHELYTWNSTSNGTTVPAPEFLSLNGDDLDQLNPTSTASSNVAKVQQLEKQLASLQRIQKATFQQLSALREENEHLIDLHTQQAHGQSAQQYTLLNGARSKPNGDVDMEKVHTDASDDSVSPSPEATSANA